MTKKEFNHLYRIWEGLRQFGKDPASVAIRADDLGQFLMTLRKDYEPSWKQKPSPKLDHSAEAHQA